MRVICPTCNAGYEVPESRIGAGRKLRCARCKNDWWVDPPEPGPAAPVAESSFARAVAQAAGVPGAAAAAAPPVREVAAAAPSPTPRDPPDTAPAPAPPPQLDAPKPAPPIALAPAAPAPSAPEQAPQSGGLLIAWLASLMIFLAVPAALLLYRAEIMEAWAPSERFYDAIRLGPDR